MKELRTSAGARNAAVGTPESELGETPTSARANGFHFKRLRTVVGWVLLVCAVLLAVEAGSSYVLYRHFARLHKPFSPDGSAIAALVKALKAKAQGQHRKADLSIDHGPLFRIDPVLGYSLNPGTYHITEQNGGTSHRFRLTVDQLGHRVTAYWPSAAVRRMFIEGDSAMFGWGLDDEQTIPWLLQARFPQFDVVNLSLTSYSTFQAKLLLDRASPVVTPDDIVVLTYHAMTNDFNVASPEMLFFMEDGFERQLGDAALVQGMTVPYGSIDAGNELVMRRYAMDCALRKSNVGDCYHPALSVRASMQVTIRAFDSLMAAHPSRFLVAFLSGADSDPVIAHLKSKGVAIADLRTDPGDPDANDEVLIDGHAGPFWHYNSAEKLAVALREAHFID